MPAKGILTFSVCVAFGAVFLIARVAWAGYIVTGPVIARETHGFGITYSDIHEIVAVEKDGQLYEFKEFWDKVDEYNASKGKCTLCVKYKCGTESSPISWGINALKQPKLLEREKDGYRSVDADYVTFPCIKR